MNSVEPLVDRPDARLREGFDGIPTSIIADVTGGDERTMESAIKPVRDDTTMAGTALTVKAAPGDNLIIHKAITMAEPGDVLVIDAQKHVESAHMGELMCSSCQANGLAGVVVDGAIRDRRELVDLGFPVYARGVHPQGPTKNNPGSINVPVSCGGRIVQPGDIVVGDDEGVAVVPAADADSILSEAEAKLSHESDLRERVRDGEYLLDLQGYDALYEEIQES